MSVPYCQPLPCLYLVSNPLCLTCSNPEYRVQLEQMLQQQVAGSGSPAMQEMMAGMDMSPEKVRRCIV